MARAGTGLIAFLVLIAIGIYIAAAATSRWARTDDAAELNVDIWDKGDINGDQFCDVDDDTKICRGFEVTRGFLLLAVILSVIALAALNWAVRFSGFLLLLAGACGIVCVVVFRYVALDELEDQGTRTNVYYSFGLAIAALVINFLAGFLTCSWWRPIMPEEER